MARKRGGLAGFYDQNKKWLKTAAPALLSFVPGVGIPLSIAAGAAMGADREGRKYFGDGGPDVFGAIRGGLEGYGTGKATQSLAGGIRSLFSPKAAALQGGGMPNLPAPNMRIGMTPGATGPITSTDRIGSAVNQYLAQGGSTAPRGASTAASLFSPAAPAPMPTPSPTMPPSSGGTSPMSFRQALRQPQVLGSAIQAGIGQLPSAQTAALNAQTELAQKEFEERQRQNRLEEERRQRIAELLAPYAMQNFPQLFGGGR